MTQTQTSIADGENHPELWLRFSDALQMPRASVEQAELLPQSKALVDTFKDATKIGSFAQAATARYCYESQVPEVARTKIAGLKEFCGISDQRGLRFFDVGREDALRILCLEKLCSLCRLFSYDDSSILECRATFPKSVSDVCDLRPGILS